MTVSSFWMLKNVHEWMKSKDEFMLSPHPLIFSLNVVCKNVIYLRAKGKFN